MRSAVTRAPQRTETLYKLLGLFILLAGLGCTAAPQDVDTTLPPTVCSRDGWRWENPRPPGNQLFGLWGTDDNHIWAVGGNGTLLKWDGSSFTPPSSGSTDSLLGVWGIDANHIWAVGENGTMALASRSSSRILRSEQSCGVSKRGSMPDSQFPRSPRA